LWSTVSAFVLLEAGEVLAAPDEHVFLTELRERQCRTARSSGGVTGGGFSSSSSDSDTLRPVRPTGTASTRAARRRVCQEAEQLREKLEWEERQASSVEAVWDAVFTPAWWIESRDRTSRTLVSSEPSELTQRFEDNVRSVLRGHPPSEREAFSNLAFDAVTSYRVSRAELVNERVCSDISSFTTGEALAAALNEVDRRAGTLKEQLIDEVWSEVGPAMADKLSAYATAVEATVWDPSPAFFPDMTPEQLARAIADVCGSSRLLNPTLSPQTPRPPAPFIRRSSQEPR